MQESKVRCSLCGGPLREDAERREGLARCSDCAAWMTYPPPSDEELERAYADWYRPDAGRFSGFGDSLLRRLRARLAIRLDAIAPPGPVLDVGAGDGTLVDALRDRGRDAVGLERHSSHPHVREGELGEVEGSWAAIVFWHSLEHLPQAGVALAQAASILAPQGVLVVAVPNAASMQAALFGARWFALDLPRHLVHIPSGALQERLSQLGLKVERVSYVRGGQVTFGWLHGFVGWLPGRPNLYDAIRRPEARERPMSAGMRAFVLFAAVLLLPLALLCSTVEVACRRGGTVCVEARCTAGRPAAGSRDLAENSSA
ncbi:MAG TPA: class I SAM-dependent methyltransferase [Solirubrobacterales bacterium]|jgi:SAM-dependent methyltransferase